MRIGPLPALAVLALCVMATACSRSGTSPARRTAPSEAQGLEGPTAISAQPVNFGGRVEYRGYTIRVNNEGKTLLRLSLVCTGRMTADYTLWFHLIGADGSSHGFDRLLDPPTTQWQVGGSYAHEVQLDAPPGLYAAEFGLWVWPRDDLRLRRNDNGEQAVRIENIQVK